MIIMEQVEEGAIDNIDQAVSIDTITSTKDQNSMQVSREAIEAIETIITTDFVDLSE